ncbi:MAG: hypothetical protein HYS98_04015 [Deltaproteobacteria bacterium]|nr:hypothetical protein [Deltaproteobacteria bacterium]
MKYSCPGKAFIFGEYACLQGFPALMMTFGPHFELLIKPFNTKSLRGEQHSTWRSFPFHPNSPAGRLVADNQDILKNFQISFKQPPFGTYGIGSSSAEFLLCLEALYHLQKKEEPDLKTILELYWKYSYEEGKTLPSGYDVLAQAFSVIQRLSSPPKSQHSLGLGIESVGSGIRVKESTFLLVENKTPSVITLPSLPDNFKFMLHYSGSKLKTHEHLNALSTSNFFTKNALFIESMNAMTTQGLQAWEKKDAPEVGKIMNEAQNLLSSTLGENQTSQIISEMQKKQGVLGVKQSGAYGGDCYLVLSHKPA